MKTIQVKPKAQQLGISATPGVKAGKRLRFKSQPTSKVTSAQHSRTASREATPNESSEEEGRQSHESKFIVPTHPQQAQDLSPFKIRIFKPLRSKKQPAPKLPGSEEQRVE